MKVSTATVASQICLQARRKIKNQALFCNVLNANTYSVLIVMFMFMRACIIAQAVRHSLRDIVMRTRMAMPCYYNDNLHI